MLSFPPTMLKPRPCGGERKGRWRGPLAWGSPVALPGDQNIGLREEQGAWAHRPRDLIKEGGAATLWRDQLQGVWSFCTRDSGWRLCPSKQQSWAGHFLSLNLTLPFNSGGWLEQ